MEVKQAIIPVGGRGTRFLPLSEVIPKEIWPLVDKPALQYIIEEAVSSGIKKLIFVQRPKKEIFLNYLKKQLSIPGISFSSVFQKKPLGDGHAVLQAKKIIKNNPCLVLFGDDIVESKIPCSKQLIDVFEKYQKPVLALYRLPREKLSSYGVAKVEKIKDRLYQIKEVVEKPTPEEAPSDLAIVGKYVIDKDVMYFLEHSPAKAKGEIRLAGAFQEMLKKGLKIYGYEFEGKWLECGNKLAYLKSNFYLSLKNQQFSQELQTFLKNII